MIVFQYVQFRNFLSFGNRDVKIDLNRNKTTLLTGDSGSGKSTIISESLTFGLFGKPFRKIKKGDVINQVNMKDCLVEVCFTIGTDEYKVIRGLKPDIFEIYQNGIMINQNPNVRDYQKYLEDNILCMSHKTWASIVVLGFANHTPFMLLSAHERRQMVDEVLGIEVFQRMHEVAKNKASELKVEISQLTNNIESIKDSIVLQKKNFDAVQAQSKEQESGILKEIDKTLADIDSFISKNALIDSELETLFDDIKNKEEILSKNNDLVAIQSKLKYKRSSIVQMIEFINSNETCPTCKQTITEDYIENFVSSESIKLAEFDDALKSISEKVEYFKSLLADFDKKTRRISELELAKSANQRIISHYQNSIEKKQEELSKLMTCDNSVVKTLASTIVDLVEKQKALTKKKSDYSNELRHIVMCQGLLKEDGIKGKIVDMYLPVLTKLVNEFLEAMNFSMRITFDSNFSETIYARFRDKLSFTQLSQGEQSRVNLAIILAWRSLAEMRNSVKVSVLILDELLDNAISAADTEIVMDLVRKINTDQNIFLISHKPAQVESYCDSTIFVEKKGNFSYCTVL